MDEIKDLLHDLFRLEESAPQTSIDLNRLDPAQIRALRDNLKALRQGWQLTLLGSEDLQRVVAAGRPGDPAHNDAYDRFLRARPDIARETLSPGVLPRLGEYVAATESVEAAVTPLALTLLEGALASEGRMRRVIGRVAEILQMPDEHEIAPGLPVRRLRVALAGYAAAESREQARLEAQRGRRARLKEKQAGEVARAEKALARDKAVARLKESARKDAQLDKKKEDEP
jgi:hypothetical protein